MEKQLIYKNEILIKETIENQDHALKLLRDVNQVLAGIKATLPIEELINLVKNFNHHETYLTDYVKNHLLDKIGDQHFNGVAIKKEKLLEMIEVPDFNELKNLIYQSDMQKKIIPSFFEKNESGEINLKLDYKEQIENRFTYYTEKEAGNDVLNLLQSISDKLMDLRRLIAPDSTHLGFQEIGKVKGLNYDAVTGNYLIDLNFIREQEQKSDNLKAI